MTIPSELEAEILRKWKGDRWKIGTIASNLQVHHGVVERVIARNSMTGFERKQRKTKVDPYKGFISEMLNKYPKLTATAIYRMARTNGYDGCSSSFRIIVQKLRPIVKREAFLRIKTFIGEEGQVDWAHFGTVKIGNATRKLYAFVMVLSWSRMIYFRFCTGMDISYFLRGHRLAFKFFNGVPKRLLYDNLKSVVRERIGSTIRFNPVFLRLSAYYTFEPRPVGIGKGNEKGRVERAIRYIRSAFWEGREWDSVKELNEQAEKWCLEIAGNRACPEKKQITVLKAFKQEQEFLRELPDYPFPTLERVEVTSGKQQYIRFDLNDYSIPYQFVRRQLVVFADEDEIQILENSNVIATHKRSYSKGECIENEEHIADLVQYKNRGRDGRNKSRLLNAVPDAEELLKLLAKRNESLTKCSNSFLLLLDEHGAAKVEKAMKKALIQNTPHPNSVRTILEQWRFEEGKDISIPIALPNDERVTSITVKSHDLGSYDEINKGSQKDDK
jgi:transposase